LATSSSNICHKLRIVPHVWRAAILRTRNRATDFAAIHAPIRGQRKRGELDSRSGQVERINARLPTGREKGLPVGRLCKLDRLLQSDFVTSPEPSTRSARRIAFAVSPHHSVPVFNRKRVIWLRQFYAGVWHRRHRCPLGPDVGQGCWRRSRPQNRNPDFALRKFCQMTSCPRI
jgi:hypothetical protein